MSWKNQVHMCGFMFQLAVTAGWLTAIGLILCTHFGIIAFIDNKYTPLQSAYYVPLHRVGWALAISWIVFACMHGYGGKSGDREKTKRHFVK